MKVSAEETAAVVLKYQGFDREAAIRYCKSIAKNQGADSHTYAKAAEVLARRASA